LIADCRKQAAGDERHRPLAAASWHAESEVEILIFVAFAILIVAGGIFSYYQNRKRREAFEALAARRGWNFSADRNNGLEQYYPGFSCLQEGSNRYAYNLLRGRSGDNNLLGFDYHNETYSTDSKGKRTTHHHYFSALILETPWPLKPLLIRDETLFDKFGEFFGVDDIDFESAEFSRKFYVKSPDRRWAFDVINQATMEFLLAAPRFTIQFADAKVIAYRSGQFVPEDFEQAEQVIQGILERLPKYLHTEWKGAQP
jgi:hypothetical protein